MIAVAAMTEPQAAKLTVLVAGMVGPLRLPKLIGLASGKALAGSHQQIDAETDVHSLQHLLAPDKLCDALTAQ